MKRIVDGLVVGFVAGGVLAGLILYAMYIGHIHITILAGH